MAESIKSKPFLCMNTNTYERSAWYLLNVSLHPKDPRALIHIPPPPIPNRWSTGVTVGHTLFALGGRSNSTSSPSRDVQIFDARLNQWSIGPPMRTPRHYPATGVIDGRIYVFGGCSHDSDSWAEVLDPRVGEWTTVPTPAEFRYTDTFPPRTAVLGGKLLATVPGGMIFDPETEPAWSHMPMAIRREWENNRAVVVDEVLYTLDYKDELWGFDPKVGGEWMSLGEILDSESGGGGGIRGSRYSRTPLHTWLANVGGILCIIWRMDRPGKDKPKIKIAKIEVSRTSCGELMVLSETGESSLPPLQQEVQEQGSWLLECMTLEF